MDNANPELNTTSLSTRNQPFLPEVNNQDTIFNLTSDNVSPNLILKTRIFNHFYSFNLATCYQGLQESKDEF